MDRVSTATIYNSLVGNLMTAQTSQVTAADQISSGKVATDLQGYGSQAETLTAMQSVQDQTQSFLDQSPVISAKLSSQDTAFGQISDGLSTASTAITGAIATGQGGDLMQALSTAFQGVVGGLNSTYNGQYLFSGGQVNTPATSATQLSDLTSAPSIGSLFNNDQYQATAQISQNTTIQTGFLASNVGAATYNAFQSIEAYDQGPNGPFTSPLTTAQTTFLQSTIATFTAASQGVTNAQAQNGLLQTQVTNTQTDLTNQSTTMQGLIGNITDADLGKASTNLQQAQLALQASAKVIASLQSDSLATLLPTA